MLSLYHIICYLVSGVHMCMMAFVDIKTLANSCARVELREGIPVAKEALEALSRLNPKNGGLRAIELNLKKAIANEEAIDERYNALQIALDQINQRLISILVQSASIDLTVALLEVLKGRQQ